MNERQSAWFIVRIQQLGHLDQFVLLHGRPHLDRNRIANPSEVFDVGTRERSRAFPNPRQMRP